MAGNIIKNKRILITGTSFIGSHLLEKLIKLSPSSIRLVNKTKKHVPYFKHLLTEVEFHADDLRNINSAKKHLRNVDIVFHLAADHGGRGYITTHSGKTSSNFLLDGSVFYAALHSNIEKLFYASSACVYPSSLQNNPRKKVYLQEQDAVPPYEADSMYGWGKLMGELTLQAYYKDYGLKSAIARFFTVYGERASESHAVIGSIAKAFIKQDPFEVWGDGTQIRNWTYVKDVVDGIIKLTQHISDARAINLGTEEHVSVNQMIEHVFKEFAFHPQKIKYTKMPTGPLNRVSNSSEARKLLGWKPKYSFQEGLRRTIEWYKKHKNKSVISSSLKKLLQEG